MKRTTGATDQAGCWAWSVLSCQGARTSIRPLVRGTHRKPRGMTLMELMFAVAILTPFLLIAFHEIAASSRTTAQASTDAAELMFAAHFAECFRLDVMQARQTTIAPAGDSVTLPLPAGSVTYQLNDQGRIERATPDGQSESGPRAQALRFTLERGKSLSLLQATWLLGADGNRELSLDTALRAGETAR